jgi:hypothetical protein
MKLYFSTRPIMEMILDAFKIIFQNFTEAAENINRRFQAGENMFP